MSAERFILRRDRSAERGRNRSAERGVRCRTDRELGAKRSHELARLGGKEWYKLFRTAKALDERVAVPPEPDPSDCATTKRTWNRVRCSHRPFVYNHACMHCLYMHMSDRLFAWPVFVPAACIAPSTPPTRVLQFPVSTSRLTCSAHNSFRLHPFPIARICHLVHQFFAMHHLSISLDAVDSIYIKRT